MKKIFVFITILVFGLVNISYLRSMNEIGMIQPSMSDEIKIDLPEPKISGPLEKITERKIKLSEEEAKRLTQQVSLVAKQIEDSKEKEEIRFLIKELKELKNNSKNDQQNVQNKVSSFSEKAFTLLSNVTSPFALFCVTTVICVLVGRNLLTSFDFFRLAKEVPGGFQKISDSLEHLAQTTAAATKVVIDSGGENTKKVLEETLGGTREIIEETKELTKIYGEQYVSAKKWSIVSFIVNFLVPIVGMYFAAPRALITV